MYILQMKQSPTTTSRSLVLSSTMRLQFRHNFGIRLSSCNALTWVTKRSTFRAATTTWMSLLTRPSSSWLTPVSTSRTSQTRLIAYRRAKQTQLCLSSSSKRRLSLSSSLWRAIWRTTIPWCRLSCAIAHSCHQSRMIAALTLSSRTMSSSRIATSTTSQAMVASTWNTTSQHTRWATCSSQLREIWPQFLRMTPLCRFNSSKDQL